MKSIRRFFRKLGPGLVTGAADNDPSGISTYSVAGATTGYSLLWLSVATLPMTIAVQGMCAKVGLVTRLGLAAVIRRNYPRWVLYLAAALLIISNIPIIAADLLGIAAGLNLLFPGVDITLFIAPVALLILLVELYESYDTIESALKWLTLVFFAYIFAAIMAKPDWLFALHNTLIPHLEWNATFLTIAVAVLGTTITPYLFFWQSAEEVEELHTKHTKASLKDALIDVNAGMLYLHAIVFFIILTTAATLYSSGVEIRTAADAARALEPLAGSASTFLFAIGLIGAGALAVPVLTGSTAFVLAETFGWKDGFEKKVRKAPGFYLTLTASMILGVIIALSGIDVIKALVLSQVLAGVIAPILLVILLLICNNRKIMGKHVNGWYFNLFGSITVVLMATIAIAAFVV
jgi:NRAMP (natural resistance-associated macrophage protein)-like metal ion transporter